MESQEKSYCTTNINYIKLLSFILITLLLAGCSTYVKFQQKAMEMQGLMDDDIEDLTESAQHLRIGEITPHWQQPLEELEVEQMVEMANGNVLAGTMDISPMYGSPSYGPYIAIDPATGEEQWRHKRKKSTDRVFNVILSEPVVLVARLDQRDNKTSLYKALSPDEGNILWETEVEHQHAAAVDTERDLLILAELSEEELQYRAIALTTGAEEWKQAVASTDDTPLLVLIDNQLITIGDDVRSMDAMTGETTWILDNIGAETDDSHHIVIEDGLIIPGEDGSLYRLSLGGKRAWSVRLSDTPSVLSGNREYLFAVTEDTTKENFQVSALSTQDGSPRWNTKLDGKLHSPLVITNQRVAFVRRSGPETRSLFTLALEDGKIREQTELPHKIGKDLSDRLIPFDSHLVVVSEKGVAAYGWEEGRWLWNRSIMPEASHEAALDILQGSLDRSAELAGVEEAGDQNETAVRILSEDLVSNNLVDRALAHQRQVYSQTERAATEGSYNERIGASRTRVMAIDRTIMSMEMQYSYEQAQAGANMVGASASAMLEARDRALYSMAENARIRAWLQHAIAVKLHDGAVQGKYFIRGHRAYFNGPLRWSVLVVDLETGRWNDISTSPYSYHYINKDDKPGGIGVQYPLLTSDRKLVSKGLGLNPNLWEPITIGTGKVVEPSLLGYEMKPADLHDPGELYTIGGATIIDKSGNPVSQPGRYRHINPFSEGLATFSGINEEGDRRMGVIDRNGEVVLPPTYYKIFQYREGFAPFRHNDKVGFINRKGEVAIEPRLSSITAFYSDDPYGFQEGLAYVELGQEFDFEPAYIDTTGKLIVPPGKYGEGGLFNEGLAVVEKRESDRFLPPEGYINTRGELVIPFNFYTAYPFSNGIALVDPLDLDRPEDTWAAINRSGEFVIEPTEEWAGEGYSFSEGRVPVRHRESRLKGYLNRNGDWAVQPVFERARGFSDGRAAVRIDTAWGFINRSGDRVVPAVYDSVRNFSEGLAAVKQGSKWGYINRDGTWALKPEYDSATSFDSGRAVIKRKGKVWLTAQK